MVSALLGFMAVSGVLGKWNLSRVDVRLIPADEIYDGLPTLLGFELINHRRRLPIFLMEVALGEATVLFPLVDPGRTQRKNLEMTFRGRGRQPLPQILVRSRFPINFFIRQKSLPPDRALTIFPRPRPCADVAYPDPGGERGSHQAWSRGQDGDISRISNYQGGEPLKLIHWKLSARHDSLKVKELSAATRAPVVLDLAQLPGGSLEQRIGAAAYLAIRMLRAGRPVGLRTGLTEIPAATGRRHKLQILEMLADYGQD
jgi:uncharacterized protein (DUF58 family)